jgi:hypothetical protein
MNTLLTIHSLVRWLIVLLGAFTLIKFAAGWFLSSKFTGLDRGLSSSFSGLMDLQVVLGLIFLIWTGVTGAGFPMLRVEHSTTMILAAVVAHLPLRWRSAADKIRFRNTLFAFVASLVLVFLGVARLPGGWAR